MIELLVAAERAQQVGALAYPAGVIHAFRQGDDDTLCGEPLDMLYATIEGFSRFWPNVCFECVAAERALLR